MDAFEVGTGDLLESAITDAEGYYELVDWTAGDYTVTIVTPLGYTAASDEIVTTVPGGGVATVDFDISCLAITADPRSIGFWKHQVGVATGGKGSAQIDGTTLCGYLDLIQAHFNSNAINQVVVYDPPASDVCASKLEVAKDLLNLKGDAGMTARAKQQLMALLLNVAAGYISLTEIISVDGMNVSQAIIYSDNLIDGPAGSNATNHEKAKTICDEINNNHTIASGVIPLSTENIAYRVAPESFSLSQNFPNPFNPSTSFTLNLPEASQYSLAIYNVAGQLVRRFSGHLEAGTHTLIWNGKDTRGQQVASGMYFYKAEAGAYSETRKMMLLK